MQKRRERSAYTLTQWNSCKAPNGCVTGFDLILDHIAEKGLELNACKEVWPYLLGLYSPTHTTEAKNTIYEAHRSSYCTLLQHCQDLETVLQCYNGGEEAAAAARAAAAEADRVAAEAAAEEAAAAKAAATVTPTAIITVTATASSPSTPQQQQRQQQQDQQGTKSPMSPADLLTDFPALPDDATFFSSEDPEDEACPSGPVITIPLLTPRQSLMDSFCSTAYPVGGLLSPRESDQSASAGSTPSTQRSAVASCSGRGDGEAGRKGSDASEANTGTAAALRFCEAQRLIVMDAIRSDFKKNSLTKVDELKSWWRSTIADNAVYGLYENLINGDEWCRGYWVSTTARQALEHAKQYTVDQKRQLVRLITLLSAYAVHDPETGYCQGMSDLALPFLMLMDDDVAAFWCFEHLMRKIRKNFAIDETGIFLQLADLANLLGRVDEALHSRLRQSDALHCHFAYRMIVVLMRRELPLDQAMRLWEMCWADDLLTKLEGVETRKVAAARMLVNQALQGHSRSPSWQAPADEPRRGLFCYFVVAVITGQRAQLLQGDADSDHIIKQFQRLRVDLWDCITRARELRLQHLGDDAPLHQRRKASAAADFLAAVAPPASSAASARSFSGGGARQHKHNLPLAEQLLAERHSPTEEGLLMVYSDRDEGTAYSPPTFSGENALHVEASPASIPSAFAAFVTATPAPGSAPPGSTSTSGGRRQHGDSGGGEGTIASSEVPQPSQSIPVASAPQSSGFFTSPPMLQRLQSALAAAFRMPPDSARSLPSAAATQPPPPHNVASATASGVALPVVGQLELSPCTAVYTATPPLPPTAKLVDRVPAAGLRQFGRDEDEEDEPEGRPLLG